MASEQGARPRPTPFEVGLPDGAFPEEAFEGIREEAEARGAELGDPGGFLMLGEVGRLLRAIQGEERGADPLQRYGAFLFHAFHFHREHVLGDGGGFLVVETPTARYLVEGAPAPERWAGELPTRAGYLQLPRHLFWAHPETDGPPEPLDGISWVRTAGDGLALLAVSGIRDDRPGLSTLPLPPVPLGDAQLWLKTPIREEGEDFETTLPGGELDRLYSITMAGELLKLAARAFAHVATVRGAVADAERTEEDDAPDDRPEEARSPEGPPTGRPASTPRPSSLPYRRVTLGAGPRSALPGAEPDDPTPRRDDGSTDGP